MTLKTFFPSTTLSYEISGYMRPATEGLKMSGFQVDSFVSMAKDRAANVDHLASMKMVKIYDNNLHVSQNLVTSEPRQFQTFLWKDSKSPTSRGWASDPSQRRR